MITDLFNKLYGSFVVHYNLRGQSRIPYLSEDELHALRDARLRETVRYAAETVPYYQSLFRKEGIDPRQIKTVEDLNRLPLLDKEAVRNNPRLFVSTSRRGRNSIPVVTSGSTGTPVQVYHDPYSRLANFAFGKRERDVTRKIYGKPQSHRIAFINVPTSSMRGLVAFYERMILNYSRPERLILSLLEPVEHIIGEINRFRPDIIWGYGSYLEILFRILDVRGADMHLPRVLIYYADSMTGEGRRLIEEKFGIPVLSRYTSVEVPKIGFFCEKRRGFHLHEDLCHVRIISAKGEEASTDEKGEVVISNFVNRGTVLLNYRIGDIASISNDRCSCGRTLKLLSELEGRVEDIIVLPDGRFVHPTGVEELFEGRSGVLQYQLIQHELKRFELRLVTADSQTYEQIISGILVDLRHLLGGSAVIESEYYQELEKQKGGKFRPVISLCKHKLV